MRYFDLDAESPELQVMRLLVELCGQVVGAEEGSLLVVDHTQDPPRELIFAMTVGSRQSEETLSGQRVPLGEGLAGIAAVTHEVQIGAPLYDGVQQAQRGEAPPGQPTAVIAAPMLIDDRLVGVITAVSFEAGKRFTSEARGALRPGRLGGRGRGRSAPTDRRARVARCEPGERSSKAG